MQMPARILLGMSLVVWMASPAAAHDTKKIDVTGTWNFEVDLGGNSGSPVFTFTQKGEKLTGKYKGQLGEADVKGTIKGGKIEFTFEIAELGKATYTGTVDNDSMKGKANYGDQLSGTFTGKRSKEKKE